MGVRGKDKRTETNLKKLHDNINHQILNYKLAFVIIDEQITNYIISSKGIVYNINYETRSIDFVRPYMEKDGHLRVTIHVNGKTIHKYIHQLVATAFIPNPENKPEVHHIDGDELNNESYNLQWVTRKEHVELTKTLEQYKGNRGSSNGLSVIYTDKQIEQACKLLSENELYPDQICEVTGISYSELQHLLHRPESWSYIKENYDISKYNKFRRTLYTPEQKEAFIRLRDEHPEYTLSIISKILNIRYDAITNWNRVYKKSNMVK